MLGTRAGLIGEGTLGAAGAGDGAWIETVHGAAIDESPRPTEAGVRRGRVPGGNKARRLRHGTRL